MTDVNPSLPPGQVQEALRVEVKYYGSELLNSVTYRNQELVYLMRLKLHQGRTGHNG